MRAFHTLYLEMTWYNGEQHSDNTVDLTRIHFVSDKCVQSNEFAVVIVFLRISGSVMYWEDTKSSTTVS